MQSNYTERPAIVRASVESIIESIRRDHIAMKQGGRELLRRAISIGKKLMKLRDEHVGERDWVGWFKANKGQFGGFSLVTAYGYIKIAEKCDEVKDSASLTEALRRLDPLKKKKEKRSKPIPERGNIPAESVNGEAVIPVKKLPAKKVEKYNKAVDYVRFLATEVDAVGWRKVSLDDFREGFQAVLEVLTWVGETMGIESETKQQGDEP